MTRLLVLQHERIEHPAAFRPMLAEAGIDWTAVHLNEGEPLPPLDGFDGLWVLGGPMDVWQQEAHPWLAPEKALIFEAVARRGMPYLGLCLGHQLLACALGGEVGPGTPEIGVMPVHLAGSSPFLEGVETPLAVLQWHGAEIKAPPAEARVLASSPACAVQVMSWGPKAFSVQFHLEAEEDTVRTWGTIPEYAASLGAAFGPGALERLETRLVAEQSRLNAAARQIFDNWCRACGFAM